MNRRVLLRASGVGALAGVTTLAGSTAHATDKLDTRAGVVLAEKLIADGPDPEHAEAMQLFGQFVGSWTVSVTENFGQRLQYPAQWHFGWILHGHGVQDVFGRLPPSTDQGTTIRIYDPALDRWRVSWFVPTDDQNLRHFEAQQVGEEIVMTGGVFEGSPMRWIFSDISSDHFHWRNEISFDDNWFAVIDMDATRIRPAVR